MCLFYIENHDFRRIIVFDRIFLKMINDFKMKLAQSVLHFYFLTM